MKYMTKLTLGAMLCTNVVFGADSQLEMPSTVPIDTFKMQENQIGIGYIQFSATLELEDDYFEDKIGDAEFKSKGLMVTFPDDSDTIIGKMFEHSYTIGKIDSELKEKTFVDNGKTYNNTYEKDGYYVGYRPAFSTDIYESDMFKIQNSTSLHFMLYSIDGSFSVNHNGGGLSSYKYNETTTGLGVKPTTVFNGTFFPINSLGLTVFGGVSTFLALNYTSYDNGGYDEDAEVTFNMASVDPIYGFDVVFRGIFSENDSFNLSSVFAVKSADTSIETIVRYIFTF